MRNDTIGYYEFNADSFAAGTVSVDFSIHADRFLKLLPPGSFILDFGCGSGRDTKYFLEHGYQVEAVDGSEKMCELASAYTGITVRRLLFQELEGEEIYDGIWACASILHLPVNELTDVLKKMYCALKTGGVIYTSFKYGTFSGMRGGRYFTNFTEETFRELLEDIRGVTPGLTIEQMWTSGDVRPGRGEEKWLNLILRKL